MAMAKKTAVVMGPAVIKAPNFKLFEAKIVGTACFVSNNFSEEARTQLAEGMANPVEKTQTKKKRDPKNFQKEYEGSLHQAHEDASGESATWYGIPATSFRAALIRACSLVGLEMTKAKMTINVLPDGFEKDGKPLVRISKGKPVKFEAYVRNSNGSPDIRSRGQFAKGWECTLEDSIRRRLHYR